MYSAHSAATDLVPGIDRQHAWRIAQAWAQTSPELPDSVRAARVAAHLARADLGALPAEVCLRVVAHMRVLMGGELIPFEADKAASEAIPYDALPPYDAPPHRFDGPTSPVR